MRRFERVRSQMVWASLGFSLVALATSPAVAKDKPNKPLEGQALVDAYTSCWGHFNKRAWDDFKGCYAKDAFSTSSGLPDGHGPGSVEVHAKPFVAAFPDVAGAQQLILASGSTVASITLITGTNSGPLKTPAGELPPTGKKFGQLVAHVVQSGDGATAKREWLVNDNGTLMAQLGVAKMPARPAILSGVAKPVVVVATGSAAEKQNLASAKKMYGHFNARDKRMMDVLADNVIDANPAVPADVVGKDAVAGFINGFWGMSSNVRFETSQQFAAGDYVVTVASFGGVNDGDHPGMGLKKTGKRFKTAIIEITKWQDGKVVQLWPFFDGADLARQLGLVPPPPAQAAR
jgi:predicted ester cyclase